MAPSFHFSRCSCRRGLGSSRSSFRVKDNMLRKLTLIQVRPAILRDTLAVSLSENSSHATSLSCEPMSGVSWATRMLTLVAFFY